MKKPAKNTALWTALVCSFLSLPAAEPQHETLRKVFSTPPEAKAESIPQAKSEAKPGDIVTLQGRVMGAKSPFVDGRSIFILGDPGTLHACSDTPGDGCATPWDTCCDGPEAIKKGTATIQVLDADGKVLKEAIENAGGLSKLSYVTVTGEVAKGSSADLLLVNATAIQVTEKPAAE